MTRLFLVMGASHHPEFKDNIKPMEVMDYNPNTHRLVCRRVDGTEFVDPNFWPMIAKRCGFDITQDVPQEFQDA